MNNCGGVSKGLSLLLTRLPGLLLKRRDREKSHPDHNHFEETFYKYARIILAKSINFSFSSLVPDRKIKFVKATKKYESGAIVTRRLCYKRGYLVKFLFNLKRSKHITLYSAQIFQQLLQICGQPI